MTPSSNRSTHYQRFIPSEEVLEVAAWAFAPVGGAPLPDSPPPAEEVVSAPTLQALEEARRESYDLGFEAGRQAGEAQTRLALEAQWQTQAAELAQRLAVLLEQARKHITQLEHHLAAEVLELSCDIARQVVRHELAHAPESLRLVVQEALALATDEGQPAVLRVHPSDAQWLQAGWEQAHPGVKLVPDDNLTPGGCKVESARAAVDASVEKRWTRAVANLGLTIPYQPGEHTDD